MIINIISGSALQHQQIIKGSYFFTVVTYFRSMATTSSDILAASVFR
jgi:hypothetical protein